jgi:16S rRNA (guanine966-N2)-methyltransferase
MRIVAGRFRGRALQAPGDMSIRPTSDRVRESVFNILAHGVEGFSIDSARVIDLFAGTGALGIEAVSRGAAYCLFVEEAPEARALIRQNVEAFGLTGETRIFRRDATDLGPAGNMEAFGLAFLDPPYGKGLGEKALAALAEGNWLSPGAVCVLEERNGVDVRIPPVFATIDTRTYGDTDVRILQFAGSA